MRQKSRIDAADVFLAISTGLFRFSVRPTEYAQNAAFLAKLGLVALALVNVAVAHFGNGWRAVLPGKTPSAAVRICATLSILFWIGAVIAGRWIGFL